MIQDEIAKISAWTIFSNKISPGESACIWNQIIPETEMAISHQL